MTTQVIVLNGGSNSGKSGIARCLQAILPDPWIRLGADDLLERLPPSLLDSDTGVAFGRHGEAGVGTAFRDVEDAWMAGVAAMARAGARVVVDDVFLGGAASQDRTRAHLAGPAVLWVGVRCAPQIAAGREIARGDRVTGMAAAQAEVVHRGVGVDRTVVGVDWGDWARTDPEAATALATDVLGRVAEGELRPPAPTTLPLDEAAHALTRLARRDVVGKLALLP